MRLLQSLSADDLFFAQGNGGVAWHRVEKKRGKMSRPLCGLTLAEPVAEEVVLMDHQARCAECEKTLPQWVNL